MKQNVSIKQIKRKTNHIKIIHTKIDLKNAFKKSLNSIIPIYMFHRSDGNLPKICVYTNLFTKTSKRNSLTKIKSSCKMKSSPIIKTLGISEHELFFITVSYSAHLLVSNFR